MWCKLRLIFQWPRKYVKEMRFTRQKKILEGDEIQEIEKIIMKNDTQEEVNELQIDNFSSCEYVKKYEICKKGKKQILEQRLDLDGRKKYHEKR